LPEHRSKRAAFGRLSSRPGSIRPRAGTLTPMPKALQPRSAGKRRPPAHGKPGLDRDLAEEIRRTTKPTVATAAIARLERAVELLERGDVRGSASEAQKAKDLAPRSPAVREVLGMALYGQGRWQEALQELKAYKRMSGRVDQNHLIADCLRGSGHPEQVVPLAEEVLRAKVSNDVKAEAVIVAAGALADQGRYADGLAFLRRAQTRKDVSEPYTLRLWYVTGDLLARLGRTEEAREEFRKVLRHDPVAFDAAERLAQLA
jgi:tetratricopeptide (TPR) repeat protein